MDKEEKNICVMEMTVDKNYCLDFCSVDLENEEFSFITITPWFTLTWSDSTCYGVIYGPNRTVWKLVVLDGNEVPVV